VTPMPRLLRCGEHAILVEVNGLEQVLALAEAVRSAVSASAPGFTDVVDVVPAATTVLVHLGDGGELAPFRRALGVLAETVEDAPIHHSTSGETIDIVVEYDGPDLDEVAKLTGLSRDQVVAAHSGSAWRVAFVGFAPGFAYLTGGDDRLHVPRRRQPRTSVPAGAVGLAGEFSAVYPRPSPGGWQLIGHTEATMWDVDRDPPALLQPGSTVRFRNAADV
jgi:KipI family sensor histidine kinase inhibitor